jgi:hypothetical protein
MLINSSYPYSRIHIYDFSLNVANFVPNFVVKFILKFTNWIVIKASDWTPVAETGGGGGGRSPPLPIILASFHFEKCNMWATRYTWPIRSSRSRMTSKITLVGALLPLKSISGISRVMRMRQKRRIVLTFLRLFYIIMISLDFQRP